MGNSGPGSSGWDVEIPPKEADAAVLSRRAAVPMLMFGFHSGTLAALFPIVLWWSRTDALLAVWRLSLLLCSYFYCATCALSAAAATTKASLFFHVLFVALVALVVDAELNQIAGLMILYLASVLMAGVFGHVLAEHRESQGAEKGASAAATKTLALAHGNAARVQQIEIWSARFAVFLVVAAACVLGCGAGASKWLEECRHHGGCTEAEFKPGTSLFMVMAFPLLFGIAGVTSHGAVLEGWIVINAGFPALCMFCFISSFFLGEVVRTVTQWILLLGMTAFFGYCLRVHDSYVKIMRKKTVEETDESNEEKSGGTCMP